jgi:hypothetical protein
VAIVVPRGWHPVVALIFRLAFASSGVALIVTALTMKAGRRGEGTIWFGAVHPDALSGPSIGGFAGAGDYVQPQFEHIADADKTLEILREATAAAKARVARRTGRRAAPEG